MSQNMDPQRAGYGLTLGTRGRPRGVAAPPRPDATETTPRASRTLLEKIEALKATHEGEADGASRSSRARRTTSTSAAPRSPSSPARERSRPRVCAAQRRRGLFGRRVVRAATAVHRWVLEQTSARRARDAIELERAAARAAAALGERR